MSANIGHVESDIRPESDIRLGQFNQNPAGIGFFRLIKEDFETHDRNLFAPGFCAIAVHRFGNWRMGIRSRLLRLPFSALYKVLHFFVLLAAGISLSYTVRVGRRVRIWHHGGMVLGALQIGNDVHIRQNTTFGVKRRNDPRWMKPTIEDGCDIGAGAVIAGRVTIGRNSVIGANVVIAQDVPPDSIVSAAPAVIKARPRSSSS